MCPPMMLLSHLSKPSGTKAIPTTSPAPTTSVKDDLSPAAWRHGEGTGHWFDKDGKIATWDPNGTSVVFSNMDLTTMTTKIGHMPNKVKGGDTFTVRQALVYGSKQVTFEIKVTIEGGTTIIRNIEKARYGKPGNRIFNVLGQPVGARNANGTLPDLPKGVYVEIK